MNVNDLEAGGDIVNNRAVSSEKDMCGLQPMLETTLVMTDVLTDCVKMPSLGSLVPMNNVADNLM